jgi:hypothetical protein
MHLVVFDIDGTLTDTCEVDSGCYWVAIQQVFRIAADQPDWSTFRHVTDSGIACESCERYLGRPANESEIDAIRQRLVTLLESALVVKNRSIIKFPAHSRCCLSSVNLQVLSPRLRPEFPSVGRTEAPQGWFARPISTICQLRRCFVTRADHAHSRRPSRQKVHG